MNRRPIRIPPAAGLLFLGGLAGFLAGVPAAPPVSAGVPGWHDHAPLPQPIANNAVATHVLDDSLYVYTFLGIDSTKVWSGLTNFAARLNTVSDQWEVLTDVPGPPRIAAAAATVGDSIYVFGGYEVHEDGSEPNHKRVDILDPATGTWSTGTDIPVRVDDMVVSVWADSLVYLISGWGPVGNQRRVQVYDPASDSWGQATQVPMFGTFGASGGICGNHVVYVDGVNNAFTTVNRLLVGEIDPLNPLTITWTDLGPHAGSPIYRAASGPVPGDPTRVVFAGGTDNAYNYDGIGYNQVPSEPLSGVWSYVVASQSIATHPDKPVPTMDHRGFPSGDGRLWVVGGMEAGQTVTDRVSSWVPDAVTAAPAAGTGAPGGLVVAPNPTRTEARFSPSKGRMVLRDARIVDVTGRALRTYSNQELEGLASFSWDLRDDSGLRVAPGVYWLRGTVSGRSVSRSIVVREP